MRWAAGLLGERGLVLLHDACVRQEVLHVYFAKVGQLKLGHAGMLYHAL